MTEGLESGEMLTVDNLAALSEGATVTVALDENGMAREQPAADAEAGAQSAADAPTDTAAAESAHGPILHPPPCLCLGLAFLTMLVGGLGLQTWRSSNIPR